MEFSFKRGYIRIQDSMAGEKIFIFDLIISKERPHRDSIKSKILALYDNLLLSYEIHSDGRPFGTRRKMVIFSYF